MNPRYLVEMTFVATALKSQRRLAAEGEPDALAPAAMRAGSHVFFSATGGDDAMEGSEAAARTATRRLVDALRDAGLAWTNLAEITLYLREAAHAAAARHAIRDIAGHELPAGTTIVCGLLPGDARVQISAMAVG